MGVVILLKIHLIKIEERNLKVFNKVKGIINQKRSQNISHVSVDVNFKVEKLTKAKN